MTSLPELLEILVRRGVVTTDPARRDECCGQPRDEDGFCTYREGHPIYVAPDEVASEGEPLADWERQLVWAASAVREVHQRDATEPYACDWCGQAWPCEAIRVWNP